MVWRQGGGALGRPAGNHRLSRSVKGGGRRKQACVEILGEEKTTFKGGTLMKKVALVVSSIALLFASGCATKEYVKTQVDPLSDRIGRIEARLNAVEAKLNQAVAKEAELSQADRAAINEAKAMSKNALDMANKAEAEALRAGGDANRAEAAAKKAEAAASEAEKAAAKTEKLFRLEQKK